MAMVTIGGRDYPSYSSVEDADIFLAADVVRAAPWATRNAAAKARALASVTRIMVGLPWCGEVPLIDNPPAVVAEVAAMFAADGLSRPKLFTSLSGTIPRGVKVATAGKASVEFFSSDIVPAANPLPDAYWNPLLAAGLVGCTGDASVNDGPYVSGICPPVDYGYAYGRCYWPTDDGREGCW